MDVGGSMFVHVFGAYFGIAVAATIYRKNEIEDVAHKELPVYDSDIFSLIGKKLHIKLPVYNSDKFYKVTIM